MLMSSQPLRCFKGRGHVGQVIAAAVQLEGLVRRFFFGHENSLFGHKRFSTLLFSMKVAESEKIVLASCIIEFKDLSVLLRHFSLNLNACRVITVFFEVPGQIFEEDLH
jgi:hypothetical protein